jgi:hypothetical protein
VKKEPWWSSIPLENYVVPLLLTLIGICNQMLARFCGIVNEYIERLSSDEVNTQRKIQILDQLIKDKTKERQEWDQTDDGKKHRSLLSRKRKQNDTVTAALVIPITTDKPHLDAITPTADPTAPTDTLVPTDNVELKQLITARKAITDIIDRTKKHLVDARKKSGVF